MTFRSVLQYSSDNKKMNLFVNYCRRGFSNISLLTAIQFDQSRYLRDSEAMLQLDKDTHSKEFISQNT